MAATQTSGKPARLITPAEVTAIAHLYRGEIYRSTIWRSRLDTTTNWSVVSLGIALSIAFSSRNASPLPLILVGFLIMFFLLLESRRYRYFNVWRARARWLENHFFAPMLHRGDLQTDCGWEDVLARDYEVPHYHISFVHALGRRLRRNYIWIFLIQSLAYYGKVMIHPEPISSLEQLWQRTAVGPIPGEVVILGGVVFNGVWVAIALTTFYLDRVRHRGEKTTVAMG